MASTVPTKSTFSASDSIFIHSGEDDTTERVTHASLMAAIDEEFDLTVNGFSEQVYAPSATGFSYTINTGDITDSDNAWLILTPAAGYAAGTIVLPPSDSCVQNQEVMVNCTQAVTTLTVSGNGATVTGAPTTLAASAFFRLKYYAPTNTWYRVG